MLRPLRSGIVRSALNPMCSIPWVVCSFSSHPATGSSSFRMSLSTYISKPKILRSWRAGCSCR